ncbi:catalase-related domain-containing protein [Paraburkholderia flava]|uniref:catalase-related domain-containing protein n=1 Tax=Paraburkholderia flava TaxID=2547393 RepID=UPI001060235C|nr:catalase-related domain-containing protein [Paraburkholderia flava]
MINAQRKRLYRNIAEGIAGVPADIVERQLALFDKIDPAYGAGVRKAIAQGAEGSETALP